MYTGVAEHFITIISFIVRVTVEWLQTNKSGKYLDVLETTEIKRWRNSASTVTNEQADLTVYLVSKIRYLLVIFLVKNIFFTFSLYLMNCL